jgi:hypothetical protein
MPLALDVPLKLFTTLSTEQLSLTVGVGTSTLALHKPVSVPEVIFAGQVIVGLVVSTRFTLNVQLEELPFASVAVKVIIVTPVPLTIVPAAGD